MISENVTGIVNAKKIIDKISLIEDRYNQSIQNTKNLLINVNVAKNSIEAVYNKDKGRNWVGGIQKQALLDLIREGNNATSESISSISKLIQNNNENSKLLSEMVGSLAMLSGLSFEKISETTAELEEIVNQINDSSSGSEVQGKQIKRIVISQIEKIKEEKKRADMVEYNFGVINENIKEVKEKLNSRILEVNTKINKIEGLWSSKLGKQFENKMSIQSKKINLLTIFSVINFMIILGFIFYNIINI